MSETKDAPVGKRSLPPPSRITPAQRRSRSKQCKRLVRNTAPGKPRSPKRQVGG